MYIEHVLVSFVLALVHPALAVFAGLGKEIWDLIGPGVADPRDLAANGLGILLALGLE